MVPQAAAVAAAGLAGVGGQGVVQVGGLPQGWPPAFEQPWSYLAGMANTGSQFAWRWSKTAEQRLLAQAHDELPPVAAPVATTPAESTADKSDEKPAPAAPAATVEKSEPVIVPSERKEVRVALSERADPRVSMPVEWPGFRGAERDGVVRGVRIETDWSATPPVELWRRSVGPGWSSFAVQGNLVYTQEQRGDAEVVSAYNLSTGEPVWRHRDRVRFYESNGGAGPRGTPAISGGRIFALGATGILNALDSRTGAVVWSHNAAADTGRSIPEWGFSSSPLVIDDVVIVAASGTLAAYDVASGTRRWVGPRERGSYSSPHRATIDGVAQVLLLTGSGATSVAPATGAVLWEHEWPNGTTVVQPAVVANGDVLINGIAAMGGLGIRRLALKHDASGWTSAERWTSNGLKPVLQRLRRPQGPRLRLRRQHPLVHRPRGRRAQVEGRPLRQRAARAAR